MPFNAATVVVRDNIKDPNLVAFLNAAPGDEILHGSTFIVTEAGTWGDGRNTLDVEAGSIVTWNALTNRFQLIGSLYKGDRFIVGGFTDIHGDTLENQVDRIVKYNGGPIDDSTSYVIVDGNPPLPATSVTVSNATSIFAMMEFRYDTLVNKWVTSLPDINVGPGYNPLVPGYSTFIEKFVELTDVDVTSIKDGDIITYDNGKFVNTSFKIKYSVSIPGIPEDESGATLWYQELDNNLKFIDMQVVAAAVPENDHVILISLNDQPAGSVTITPTDTIIDWQVEDIVAGSIIQLDTTGDSSELDKLSVVINFYLS